MGEEQVRFHRILFLCCGVGYLGWWVFVRFALPDAFNPFLGRALVVAPFFAVLAASYRWQSVVERLPDALAVCCGLATVHYFYLLDDNDADLEWVIGSYITITAVCAILQTARSLLYYSVFVALLSVALLVREPALSFVVFMPGTLTILIFANIGLRSRLRVLAQLQASVTAHEQAEAALVLANQELESFSYSIAHDLRTPLRSIDGFSQMLLEDHSEVLDQSGRGYLHKVRAQAQHMAELIDSLLALARVGRAEIKRQKVDLSLLATRVVEQLRSREPDRKVTCTIQERIFVDADRQLLQVVLENLIGNALKFSSKAAEARIEVFAEGDVVSVRDNGAGFDMAYASKLFVPFQRLHRSDEFPGTGIGLATVHRIVQRHGGRIWAESVVRQGATFNLTLPPLREPASAGASSQARAG